MKQVAIGIDLGGTTIKGAIMKPDGTLHHLTRVPTEVKLGSKRILDNILNLIGLLIEKHDKRMGTIAGVGIGTPGFIDHEGLIVGGAANLPDWPGMQLFKPIKKKFDLKAAGGNDVTVAALGEAKFGAGRGVANMVCFALGTGIGGGLVINGHVFQGSNGMAAELGHICVQTDGLQCNCGQRGCVEQYASATGIVHHALMVCQSHDEIEYTDFIKAVRTDAKAVTAKMVYDYVKLGDPVAKTVNDYICDKLARAIGVVLNTLSPDRVVLGGGVMMAGKVIIDTVNKFLPNYCWKDIYDRCDLVAAELGEDAGVMGAGALVFDEFGSSK